MRRNNSLVFDIINSNQMLKEMFKWYINHNASLSLPYHNLNHTLGMMQLIIDLSVKSRKDSSYGFVINDEGMFILLTSALFHDYNHSGSRFDDSINIELAKIGLKSCLDSILIDETQKMKLINVCSAIIDATEYPYTIEDSDLTLYQRIIRECDILVVMFDDFITQCQFGLFEEMRLKNPMISLSKYTKFLLDSFAEMKLKFSMDLFNEHKDKFLKQIESFYQLLK